MFFFFKQKTAYEMRISDWSSDVCSSDLGTPISDDRSHSRGDDRNARADTDADADGKSDLTEAEAARGHAGEAERQRDDRDDLAARAFEKRGEFVKRGVEGRIGAGERRPCEQHERSEDV